MRLLSKTDDGEIRISLHLDRASCPPYAIVSHTWGAPGEEVALADLENGTAQKKVAYWKLEFAIHAAEKEGLQHIWIDTCCLDFTSSTELSRAINSAFRWYQAATLCLVLLVDVQGEEEDEFRQSRWFTRAWTLQELIAPRNLTFFSRRGVAIGTKRELVTLLHEITSIPVPALRGVPLHYFSVEERLSWGVGRQAMRDEDLAYSMQGLFDVFMPMMYGEGKVNALLRLEAAIDEAEKHRQSISAVNNVSDRTLEHLSGNDPHNLYSSTLGPASFRLLTIDSGMMGAAISGTLTNQNLLKPPSFYALSYVWGTEPRIHKATINGVSYWIQPNLFHALQRIRLPIGCFPIWVDTICIDQSNTAERNNQVRQMANIYQCAVGVVIWLGEEDAASKIALDYIDRITSEDHRWARNWWQDYGLQALTDVLNREWFRRRWVIQEAAFSRNSTVYCGDRQIYLQRFTAAIRMIEDQLSTVFLPTERTLTLFRETPAMRLMILITDALRKPNEDRPRRMLSLDSLVLATPHSETMDRRDTIYAMLNLANDVLSHSGSVSCSLLAPDYNKPVLDVFADFIQHCCQKSGHIDTIICPWAPTLADERVGGVKDRRTDDLQEYPSWIATRDGLPFGNPSWQSRYRLHGNPLASRTPPRAYFAHHGTRPEIHIGRSPSGLCNGSLRAKGILLGPIVRTSVRMADGIITRDSMDVLRLGHEADDEWNTIWRTLCADRDENGGRAPHSYGETMLELLRLVTTDTGVDDAASLQDKVSSIDPEELLNSDNSDDVEQFLRVVRDMVWNRRTFRLQAQRTDHTMVGLSPQHARVGDQVCVLYGCSVPVVLRKLDTKPGEGVWRLVGEAYVHGAMDGEVISSVRHALRSFETEFDIR